MHRKANTRLSEVNPHLICVQCGGYFIDATTIIECLHSFCKTCILKHLETSKHCPVCDVMVHRTRPLQNIRPDKTLQDLVYKLVPGLFASEMKRRRDFYASAAEKGISSSGLSLEERGEAVQEQAMIRENEQISLCLELSVNGKTTAKEGTDDDAQAPGDRRYLLCPSAVTIGHLKKLVRMKYSLLDNYQIDMFHTDQRLRDTFTLLDIAYIYAWRRKEPLKLYYTVFDKPSKKVRFSTEVSSKNVDEQLIKDSLLVPQKDAESKSSVSDHGKMFHPIETTKNKAINRMDALPQTRDKETEINNDKHVPGQDRSSAEDTSVVQTRNGTATLSKSSSDSDDGTISKELQRCGLSVQSFKNETHADKECAQSTTGVNCVKHDLVSTDMCHNRAVESVDDQLSDSSPGHPAGTGVKCSAGENGIGSSPLHIEIGQNGSVRSDSETLDSPGSSVLDYSMPCESLDLSLSKATDINRNLSLDIKNNLNRTSKQEVQIENGRAFIKNTILPATSCGNTSPQRGVTCLSRDGKYEPDRNGSQNRVPKSPLIPPLYPMNATSPESSCVTFQGEKRCFQQVAKSSKKCFSDKRQKMSHLDSVVRKIQNFKPMDQSPNGTNNNGGEGFQDFNDEPLDLSDVTMVI